ncbi:MAG TPA: protein-L-isoaspartate O-methyltransferase [Opitutae bacterium]|nr:protein-L-isoaspartate O-methyltransferase [Opitutae bacterium]
MRTLSDEFDVLGSRLGLPGLDPDILNALRTVPRDAFVSKELQEHAWENHPLSIGHGQTISQPFIVALMTALIQPQKSSRVLEVGTGCGYQAAVLSVLVDEVYTIERIAPLADEAKARLKALGYSNVHVLCADGYAGWPEHAPYDAMLVTAGALSMPPPLLEQLKGPGRCVIPIEERYGRMDLRLIEKTKTGKLNEISTIPVSFVPFIHTNDDTP